MARGPRPATEAAGISREQDCGCDRSCRGIARLASGGARAESLWVPPGYSSNVEEIALPLMPCFLKDHNQAYEEGVIVGRLFAGYGELEMAMCACIIEETRG
jgi:hypothetical protein